MSRSGNYFSILEKMAISLEYDSRHRARIASCIVYRNDIISFGVNKMKSHPFQKKFSKNIDSIYLHSEIDCIKNALRIITQDELSKSTLYICRVKFDGNNLIWGLSRPCSGCMNAISTFGIKKVAYTATKNEFEYL